MKILFYGDSITDMSRVRDAVDTHHSAWGYGYVRCLADKLMFEAPNKYEIVNRGISGNRIVDLYARMKVDVWNHKPDVLSIFIGVNDVWHGLYENPNDVELDRFDRIYRMFIDDTLKVIPNVKIMLIEPFIVHGDATNEVWDKFSIVLEYAKVVKQIAKDYGFPLVEIQNDLTKAVEDFGSDVVCKDGVHPSTYGMNLIAKNWYKVFKENFDKE
jgi:lysophospholipase L1-like esterase